jgi:hypothetical protein
MGVAYRAGAMRVRPGPREPELRKARVCYDHLAGELGVLVYDSLEQRRLLQAREGAPQLTRQGEQFFPGDGHRHRGVDARAAARCAARAWTGACGAITSPARWVPRS